MLHWQQLIKLSISGNSMQVIAIKAFKDNYIWLLVNTRHEVIVIDPGDGELVLNWLWQHQAVLKAIFITHHHQDHVGGIPLLQQHCSPAVYGPALENITGLTYKVKEKDLIELPFFPAFMVLDTPGHTQGHVVYYGQQALFCGDTLFGAGCGRLFEGSAQQMLASLTKIASLPDQTLCYCAHEYTVQNLCFAQYLEPNNEQVAARLSQAKALCQQGLATVPFSLAEEKATNPFLRIKEPALIKALEYKLQNKPADFSTAFAQLRKLKDDFKI